MWAPGHGGLPVGRVKRLPGLTITVINQVSGGVGGWQRGITAGNERELEKDRRKDCGTVER